ncbi:MAG: nucleotide sugar dehydrogenase [Proteobacteria bacterium]|nr:nucleotide sugar dehydrogenase [Pseudomonadota bacterium]
MNVVMIGTGYVGLVSGTCFAELGFNVTCVDNNPEKITALAEKGIIPIYEPGLEELVWKHVKAGRLHFTTDLKAAVGTADVVFICVGTPPAADGRADLQYVFAAAAEVAAGMTKYTVVVDKSTVPVGTGDKVADIIRTTNPKADFDVVSNPEFLREGNAIGDFMNPDRIVLGVSSDKAGKVMERLYKPLSDKGFPLLLTAVKTAELIKYASNAFLAVKIGFINEMADLCEAVGADVKMVAKGMGMDKRIGEGFLNAGPGYGGSCFPKDTLAIAQTAQDYQRPLTIVESVITSNTVRKTNMAKKVINACGGTVKGKTIALLGLAFKANTDDMREAPSLAIVPELQKAGALIKAYDPAAMHEAGKLMSGITFCQNASETLTGADAAVVVTEWPQFGELTGKTLRSHLKGDVVVDLRNMLKADEVVAAGLTYVPIGKPVMKKEKTA